MAVAKLALGLTLAIVPLTAILFAIALTNVFLNVVRRSTTRPADSSLRAILLLDTLLLTGALAVSGGPANPFSVLYLVHIILAALILGTAWTWIMSAFSVLGYGFLFVVSTGHEHGHEMGSYAFHLEGMWFAFTLTAMLIAFFVSRILAALKEREKEAAELELRAARADQFASLVNLSAGAAHELGTPLATIAIAAGELVRGFEKGRSPADQLADAALISEEVKRCKSILENMGAQGSEARAEMPTSFTLSEVFSELQESVKPLGIASAAFEVPEPNIRVVLPRRILVRSLFNLLRNAAEADPSRAINVSARLERGLLGIRVSDRGTGIPQDLVHRIGEPFLTTKPAGKGMGLGVFLARVFAERMGGALEFSANPGSGTVAELQLPAAVIEGAA